MKQIKFNYLLILSFIIFIGIILWDIYWYNFTDDMALWGMCQVFFIIPISFIIDKLESHFKTFTKLGKWLIKERTIDFK